MYSKTETENGVLDDVIILCSWKIPQHDSTINPFSGSLLKMFERSPMENFPCMSNCPILQNSLRGQISTTLCQVRIWADFSLRSCSIAAAKLQCCWLVKKVGYKRSVETSQRRNRTALCNILTVAQVLPLLMMYVTFSCRNNEDVGCGFVKQQNKELLSGHCSVNHRWLLARRCYM